MAAVAMTEATCSLKHWQSTSLRAAAGVAMAVAVAVGDDGWRWQ